LRVTAPEEHTLLATERIIASAGIVWMITAIILQWLQSRGSGRKDYSVKAGDALIGVLYNFTYAMLPSHKETIRLHPWKFTIGLVMHIGIFLAFARVIVLLFLPKLDAISPVFFGSIIGLAAICGLYLFVRRAVTRDLQSMSSPEDYISVLMTIGFLIVAMLHEFGVLTSGVFLICAAILFFYMPGGKLKHAWFFFIARTEYGARLGYRGVYPAKRGAGEQPDV
jgi:nitrate reductase gamma subunit